MHTYVDITDIEYLIALYIAYLNYAYQSNNINPAYSYN